MAHGSILTKLGKYLHFNNKRAKIMPIIKTNQYITQFYVLLANYLSVCQSFMKLEIFAIFCEWT